MTAMSGRPHAIPRRPSGPARAADPAGIGGIIE